MKNYIEYDSQMFPIEYDISDIVYIKTDVNQLPNIVTGYQFRGTRIEYCVSHVANERCFCSYEISTEQDQLLKSISNNGDD